MANRLISDEEFLATALELFRTYGFEGVSVKRLADATGLEKASLYYRYPGGKDEIVMAVATNVATLFEKHVFGPLAGPGSPRKRLASVLEQLWEFYGCGAQACVMDMLSIPGGSDELKMSLKATMQAWLRAFTDIAKESGLTPAMARARAEEAIVRFEGSLILARVMGDGAPFERALKVIPELLTVV
jgi:TetR/AcrR family transcriptional regulator, lmrAB and yxaGH operons repressor